MDKFFPKMIADIILFQNTTQHYRFNNLKYYDQKCRPNKIDYYELDDYTLTIGLFKEDGLHVYMFSLFVYNIEIIEK